jgi:hypothetical protein
MSQTTRTANVLELRSAARAIAYAAEVEGMDPEPCALLYPDLTPFEARRAVEVAITFFGLSAEAEWAEDFLAAHARL